MDLERRLRLGDRRANLQHVRAEHEMAVGRQVVGVVLHEGRPAGQPRRHDFHGADERGRLPVAFRPEAEAVGHQSLRREARKLLQAAEVLECGGEALEPALAEESSQAEFESRAVDQRLVTLAASPQRRRDVVTLLVFGGEGVRLPVRHGGDRLDQLADPVAVGGEAELHFRRDLVPLGHRDLAHVVAEAAEPRALPIAPCPRGAHPRPDALVHLRVRPVSDHDLAAEPHARVDEPGLAVAVRRLVQVHEVHVDRGPGQVPVELRMQVDEGLLEDVQAADPHLGRRERVHPENQPGAILVGVRLLAQFDDLIRGGEQRLVHDLERQFRRSVEPAGDIARVGGDLLQRPGAIEVLRSAHEPDFGIGKLEHWRLSSSWGSGTLGSRVGALCAAGLDQILHHADPIGRRWKETGADVKIERGAARSGPGPSSRTF